MIKRGCVILSAVCLWPGTGRAQKPPFIGRWTLVPAKSTMPDEMKVQSKGANTYSFDFGGGLETVVVDGSDQPGLGGSLLSVKEEAPDTWTVKRKTGGRLLISATWKLSADGETLTDYYREFASDGSTRSVDYVYQRAAKGSGFAADWRSIRETINSPIVMDVTEYQGDGLSIADPLEQRTKNVNFGDQDDLPTRGSNTNRGATSSMRRSGERTLVVTDKFDGKVVVTEELVLSIDLKVLTMTVHIVGRHRPTVLVFERSY